MKYILTTTVGAFAIEKANLNVENYITQKYFYFDSLIQDLENKVKQLPKYFKKYIKLKFF